MLILVPRCWCRHRCRDEDAALWMPLFLRSRDGHDTLMPTPLPMSTPRHHDGDEEADTDVDADATMPMEQMPMLEK